MTLEHLVMFMLFVAWALMWQIARARSKTIRRLLDRLEEEELVADCACAEVATHSDFSAEEIHAQYLKAYRYDKEMGRL